MPISQMAAAVFGQDCIWQPPSALIRKTRHSINALAGGGSLYAGDIGKMPRQPANELAQYLRVGREAGYNSGSNFIDEVEILMTCPQIDTIERLRLIMHFL